MSEAVISFQEVTQVAYRECVCPHAYACTGVSVQVCVFFQCFHVNATICIPVQSSLFLSDVCSTERQTEVYQHLRFHSDSNLQHIKDVWFVLCSLLKSLNTLFNHIHAYTQTRTHLYGCIRAFSCVSATIRNDACQVNAAASS